MKSTGMFHRSRVSTGFRACKFQELTSGPTRLAFLRKVSTSVKLLGFLEIVNGFHGEPTWDRTMEFRDRKFRSYQTQIDLAWVGRVPQNCTWNGHCICGAWEDVKIQINIEWRGLWNANLLFWSCISICQIIMMYMCIYTYIYNIHMMYMYIYIYIWCICT